MPSQTLSPTLANFIAQHGLDISVVEVKDLWLFCRIEAEFYTVQWTKSDIESVIATAIIGSADYGTSEALNENWIWMPTLRLNEFEGYFISQPSKYCYGLNNNTVERLLLKKGDVLICRTNGNPQYVWKTAIVMEDKPYIFASYLFRIRTNEKLNAETLTVFLNSKYGRMEIEKYSMISNQANFSPAKFRELHIPLPSQSFQSSIAQMVQTAHTEQEKSKSFYAEAEKVLLGELGLLDWKPTEANIDIKTSNEVQLFGRCDAEFFQPKYDELFERLSKFEVEELGKLVDYEKGTEPWTDEYTENDGVPFVRVSDVDIWGIKDIEKRVSYKLAENYNSKYSPKKDDILFTKDGTIGISFVVNEDMNVVLSGAFLRFSKKKPIESEYLALVLNSIVCKLQIEQLSGWAIIAHLKPSDAMTLKIPILSPQIQSKISSLIISSHQAQKRSKELLEQAKNAVEVFVEEGEEVAERELKENS